MFLTWAESPRIVTGVSYLVRFTSLSIWEEGKAGWQGMPGACCIFAGGFALLVCTFFCLSGGSGLPVFFVRCLAIVDNVPFESIGP